MQTRTDSSTGWEESPTEIHWGEALAEHAHWLRTVIRSRLNEPQAVDDVMQEVALGVLKSNHRPSDPSKVAPWLYRVSIKQCLMYRRSAGRRRKLVNAVVAQRPPAASMEGGDPLKWLLGKERQQSIRLAFESLPELDRQILFLKHAENWSYLIQVRDGGINKNNSASIDQKFQLSPMLAAKWGVSEYRRGALAISEKIFNALFDPSMHDQLYELIKDRLKNMQEPHLKFLENTKQQNELF